MRLIIFTLLLSTTLLFAGEPAHKQFYEMTNREIGQVVYEYSQKDLTITEKMNQLSDYFIGTDYDLHCTGDGPYALLETWPLVNFKQTNCMAFCEHVLALSISDSWDHFFDNLQQIRYRDGLIGMKTRNHYTMGDWLPQNSWILKDVTQMVGGTYAKPLTRTISHQTFFKGKGMTDMRDVLPNRTMTIHYVPLNDLDKIKANTHAGDILSLIIAGHDDIFSAHMLMIVEKNGVKIIREASNSKMTTFDTPYDEWVQQKKKLTDRYLGLAFMRVKESLNTKGRVIKPWEIAELKKK